MVRICPDCCNIDIDKLEKLGLEIVEECIGVCGTEFVAYVDDELIEADSEGELIEKIEKAT
ncbi:DUF1450 domain-containing protein [Alkalicella caledoniensis]|uniref:DUF1450 domain-containing protein n=1 Tax=Alkalicella caledoniensis TaxID=2731377 RepID=A0A7G9W7N2_ALKCA|nr:DUF1450 domain-containing protein [Alkalicella caledoniensis]QNO14694.1 DUF1450 domain-containing protein [Alkalicella caledoniensis]